MQCMQYMQHVQTMQPTRCMRYEFSMHNAVRTACMQCVMRIHCVKCVL